MIADFTEEENMDNEPVDNKRLDYEKTWII